MTAILDWIWLTQRARLGAKGQRALVERFGTPEELWRADQEALERAGIPPTARKTLLDKDLAAARAILARCEEAGLSLVTLADPAYPARLRLVADAPVLLYYRGTLPGEDRPIVGLVGARDADGQGLALARRLGGEIAACGGLVCTGLAKGVDAQSAEGALEAGGRVIGVLGCGPDVVYPRENAALFARTAEAGCLLSEYPPGTAPNARHFPVRNRLISALSDGVAVVRARSQSGSLITARWAAAQGRDVFAVPGDPADPLSQGCNALLRDGAYAAASGWDVLRHYEYRYPKTVARASCPPPRSAEASGARHPASGAPASDAQPPVGAQTVRPSLPEDLPPIQRQIAEALLDGPLQLDALIDRTGLPASRILPELTLLQIKKLITQKPGKTYELSGG